MDGQTDMTTLIVVFRNFAKAPKKFGSSHSPLGLQGQISYENIAVYSENTRHVNSVWPTTGINVNASREYPYKPSTG
jgi:hypothetical protein